MNASSLRLLAAAALLPGLLFAQRTIYVDGSNPGCPGSGTKTDPYCAIQDAITAAAAGDSVLVMPGTYNENLDFLGKAIAVRSSSGPRITVIDAQSRGSGVKFVNGEGKKSVLEGFTIRNGAGTVIRAFNRSVLAGGGILCQGASPTISRVVLEQCNANFGAGICGFEGASPTVTEVVLRNNVASVNGGGACFMFNCRPLLSSCIFTSNSCIHTGGAINFRNDCFPVIANCVFDRNDAQDMGGAIRAGALSGCTIDHCTFYQNSSRFGGAVAAGSDTSGQVQTTLIRNSIFWNNLAPNGPELSLNGRFPAIIDIAYSDVRGGQSPVYVQASFTLSWGSGMLASDPGFVDSANGDFHLWYTSPCKDRGTNPAADLPETDFEGDPRVADTTTDMGSDEVFPHLYHTGVAAPSALIILRIHGRPTNFAILLVALQVLPSPVSIAGIAGSLHLDPQGTIVVPMGTFPATGFVSLPFLFPSSFPPAVIPTQALSGLRFTNLHTVRVN